jgi:CRP-like cAMP-binding protein
MFVLLWGRVELRRKHVAICQGVHPSDDGAGADASVPAIALRGTIGAEKGAECSREDDFAMLRPRELGRIRSALASSSHFQFLEAAELDQLAGLGRLQHLRNAQRIAQQASTSDDRLWIVLGGAVRVSARAPGSKEYVYAVLGPGSYFGLADAVRGMEFTAEARAFGDTDLAVFRGAALAAMLEERPRLWRHVSRLLAHRLRLALAIMRDNSGAPLPERVARRLLGHALSSDVRGLAEVAVRMTQQDLALMLGVSRSRTNAALRQLEREGLIRAGYRGITITDLPGLRGLAGPGTQGY